MLLLSLLALTACHRSEPGWKSLVTGTNHTIITSFKTEDECRAGMRNLRYSTAVSVICGENCSANSAKPICGRVIILK